jgi:hypothetical protein
MAMCGMNIIGMSMCEEEERERKQEQLSLITEMCVLRSGELCLEQRWHE